VIPILLVVVNRMRYGVGLLPRIGFSLNEN